MIEKRSKEIGGTTYHVTQMGALQGRKVLTRLAKVLVPALAKAESGVEAVATEFCSALGEEDMEYLCDTFAKMTDVEIEGKTPKLSAIFDMHFAGKYLEMLTWLAFCVEVNFASFFSGQDVSALVARAVKTA